MVSLTKHREGLMSVATDIGYYLSEVSGVVALSYLKNYTGLFDRERGTAYF